MLTALLGRTIIILFGVLHPSYRTYKAIKRRDYQEVVVLGMYWVVFGMFTTVELFTDMFLQWFPFYHEMKIVFVIWLVTPATSGYSLIYRRLIHPELEKRETEIDDAISKATEKGYTKVVEFGAKGLNYAAKTFITTALMGQDFLADQLRRRSASMSDLSRHHPIDYSNNRQNRNRFEAGDQRDLAAMFNSDPNIDWERTPDLHQFDATNPENDPFALHWLHPGSSGSLGRHWRPVVPGLTEVPEDIEQTNDTVSRQIKIPKRSSNVAQAYLRMIAPPKPSRTNSLPSSYPLAASFTPRHNLPLNPNTRSVTNTATGLTSGT